MIEGTFNDTGSSEGQGESIEETFNKNKRRKRPIV